MTLQNIGRLEDGKVNECGKMVLIKCDGLLVDDSYVVHHVHRDFVKKKKNCVCYLQPVSLSGGREG